MGPSVGLDKCGKSRPHRDSIPEIFTSMWSYLRGTNTSIADNLNSRRIFIVIAIIIIIISSSSSSSSIISIIFSIIVI